MNAKETMDADDKARKVRAYASQCNGSEHFYQHGLVRRLVYTDGAKFVADTCGAHWLIDVVASYQLETNVLGQDFQVWEVSSEGPSSCLVTLEDGNGNKILSQHIGFTDFPQTLMPFKLWAERGDGRMVLMLPEER